MTNSRHFLKDPSDNLNYTIDWGGASDGGPWLASGESITTSTWTVPDGITEVSTTNDETTATIRVSGGTAGTRYALVNHIVTSDSNEADRSIYIDVIDR